LREKVKKFSYLKKTSAAKMKAQKANPEGLWGLRMGYLRPFLKID
jgi:hypothetical protein